MKKNKIFLCCITLAICTMFIVLLVPKKEETPSDKLTSDKYIQKTTDNINKNPDSKEADNIMEDVFNSIYNEPTKMVTLDDINSMEDYTDERLLSGNVFFKGVAYGGMIEGNTLTKNMGYFSGCDYDQIIEVSEETILDLSIETDMREDVIKVSVISDDKIQHISLEGERITIPKGKSYVVISGYKAKGKLEIVINNSDLNWLHSPNGMS